MRITCPSCTTSYSIAGDKVGAKGRSVRCASCGTKWQVEPEPEDAAPLGSMLTQDASDDVNGDWAAAEDPFAAASDESRPREPAPLSIAAIKEAIDKQLEKAAQPAVQAASVVIENEPEIDLDAQLAELSKRKDIESFAKKPKIKVSKKKPPKVRKPFKFDMDRFLVRARPVFGALVLAMSIGVIGLAVMLRTPIVAAFPSLASFYSLAGMPVNLRGLEFANLQMLREVENAQPVLVVEGELSNPGTTDREVPAIRFSLRGDDAQEIYAWSIDPKTPMLIPGATMRFRTRLASPPEQAADIQVRMIDRRNRQAALHE